MVSIPVEVLAQHLQEEALREGVVAYWVVCGNRQEYAQELLALVNESETKRQVVPLVVRDGSFRHDNAFQDDLQTLLVVNEEEFCRIPCNSVDRLAVVILSKVELTISDAASPCKLPYWFPLNAGEEIKVPINDVTYRVKVPFSDENINALNLSLSLYDIQDTAMKVMERVFTTHPEDNSVTAWYADVWENDKDETYQDNQTLFDAMRKYHDGCNRSEFRPGAKLDSVIGQIVRVWGKSSPDRIRRYAGKFLDALGLAEKSPAFSTDDGSDGNYGLSPVLLGSANRSEGGRVTYGIALFANVFAAHKVLTAYHHSGDYPDVPFHLLRGLVLDLDASLKRCKKVINRHLQTIR